MINPEKDPLSKFLTPAFIVGLSLYLLKGLYDDTVETFCWAILPKKNSLRREWRKYREKVLRQEKEKRKIEGLIFVAKGQREEGLTEDSEETEILLFKELRDRDNRHEQRTKNLRREESLYPHLGGEESKEEPSKEPMWQATSPFQAIFKGKAK